MRSCRDVSALVSLGLDRKLTLLERLTVRLHLLMCSRCRNFQTQARFLRKAARRYAEEMESRWRK